MDQILLIITIPIGSSHLEVLSYLSQIGRTHHIISVLELTALLHHSFSHQLLTHSIHSIHTILLSYFIIPFYLKLSHSWFFNQYVSNQFGNIRFLRRVLVHFLIFIEIVHIVSHSEEFLLIVRTCQQDCCYSNNFRLRNLTYIWSSTLNSFNLFQIPRTQISFNQLRVHPYQLLPELSHFRNQKPSQYRQSSMSKL